MRDPEPRFEPPAKGERVVVSACLLGCQCRYNAEIRKNAEICSWPSGRVVPVCPEELGGLPTPRPAAEIEPGADGGDVLAGRAKVFTESGEDVTGPFVAGARASLEVALSKGCRRAFLKSRSPSCGFGELSGRSQPANGIFSELMRQQGLAITPVDFDR